MVFFMNVFLFGGILNLEELDWEIVGQLVDGVGSVNTSFMSKQKVKY